MSERVHGHEVMEMMVESGTVYTRESLRTAIVERFGPDTRFYTCSADGMTPDDLITFLEARGKFVPAPDGFTTDESKLCSH